MGISYFRLMVVALTLRFILKFFRNSMLMHMLLTGWRLSAIRDAKKKAAIKLTGTRVPSYEIVNRRSERMKLALQSVMASCSTGLRRLGGRFPGCYDSRVNIQ